MSNHTFRYESTLEMGNVTWVDADLIINFDHEPADPSVGMEASINVNTVDLEVFGITVENYRRCDKAEVESLCWQWLEEQRDMA